MPPLTGESTQATLRAAHAWAATPATVGPVVDRSTSTCTFDPRRTPWSPVVTACTIGGVGRLMKTTSACEATSSADAATWAPRAASGAVAAALVS